MLYVGLIVGVLCAFAGWKIMDNRGVATGWKVFSAAMGFLFGLFGLAGVAIAASLQEGRKRKRGLPTNPQAAQYTAVPGTEDVRSA